MRQRGLPAQSGNVMNIVLVIIIVVVIFGLVGYFVMNNMNSTQPQVGSSPVPTTIASPSPEPVSQDDSTDAMQTELENTTSGSIDAELNQLESEASSL